MPDQWFCKIGGAKRGPFSPQQLKGLVAARKLHPDDLVRHGSEGAWMPAQRVKGLFAGARGGIAAPRRRKKSPLVPVAVVSVACVVAIAMGVVAWQVLSQPLSSPAPVEPGASVVAEAAQSVAGEPEPKPAAPVPIEAVAEEKPTPKPKEQKPVAAESPPAPKPEVAAKPAASKAEEAAKPEAKDEYSDPGMIDLSQPLDVKFKDPPPKPNPEMAEELFGPRGASDTKPETGKKPLKRPR